MRSVPSITPGSTSSVVLNREVNSDRIDDNNDFALFTFVIEKSLTDGCILVFRVNVEHRAGANADTTEALVVVRMTAQSAADAIIWKILAKFMPTLINCLVVLLLRFLCPAASVVLVVVVTRRDDRV